MMNYENMTPEQREAMWKRQDDARTLARAEEIRADKERMTAAKQGAREILQEETTRLNGLARVASRKIPGSSRPQPEHTTPGGCARYQNPATIGKLFP